MNSEAEEMQSLRPDVGFLQEDGCQSCSALGGQLMVSDLFRLSCSLPKRPHFGEVSVLDLLPGGTARFHCHMGYHLQGAPLLTCLNASLPVWSGPVPSCRALCGGTVKNATVGRVLSPSPHHGPYATQDRSCSWSLEAPKDQRLHLHLERLALGATDSSNLVCFHAMLCVFMGIRIGRGEEMGLEAGLQDVQLEDAHAQVRCRPVVDGQGVGGTADHLTLHQQRVIGQDQHGASFIGTPDGQLLALRQVHTLHLNTQGDTKWDDIAQLSEVVALKKSDECCVAYSQTLVCNARLDVPHKWASAGWSRDGGYQAPSNHRQLQVEFSQEQVTVSRLQGTKRWRYDFETGAELQEMTEQGIGVYPRKKRLGVVPVRVPRADALDDGGALLQSVTRVAGELDHGADPVQRVRGREVPVLEIRDELDPHRGSFTDHALEGDLPAPARVEQNHGAGVQPAPQLNISDSDMVTITDGDEVAARILARYVGGTGPFKLSSTTPDLTVTFHSDPAGLVFGKGEGFIINYMVMYCSDPGHVEHSTRSLSDPKLLVGTTIQYSCKPGFILQGGATVTCYGREPGTPVWTSRLPHCVSEDSVSCENPGLPDNGYQILSKRLYLPDESLTFVCYQGYELIGEVAVKCILGNPSFWSGPLPLCRGENFAVFFFFFFFNTLKSACEWIYACTRYSSKSFFCPMLVDTDESCLYASLCLFSLILSFRCRYHSNLRLPLIYPNPYRQITVETEFDNPLYETGGDTREYEVSI
ncbi:seizure 6-like protein [Etheostoma cragini]|uniref:seizure 6-like protein n=1 Tax=Etheostoma cragini TaxID=417921 RepID=UPI00155E7605|nr:seizure 6-like protein [Etheostoma cragini]